MTLEVGFRLGQYEIPSRIGASRMGEVYTTRDSLRSGQELRDRADEGLVGRCLF